MKEIKAYIRRDEVNQVVEKLHDAGAPGVAIIKIHPLDHGYEANPFVPHGAGLADRYRHLAVVKLEIICRDAELERLVQVIRGHCHTGNCGDGMLFVSDVVDAIRISDGARGEPALAGIRPFETGSAPRPRGIA
jgi:nitrogen regulatory protein P-II 1